MSAYTSAEKLKSFPGSGRPNVCKKKSFMEYKEAEEKKTGYMRINRWRLWHNHTNHKNRRKTGPEFTP